MNALVNEVAVKVRRWNARASQAHDEYLGDITMLVFDGDYDYGVQKNDISDYEKLSKIWKLLEHNNLSDEEIIDKVKHIINL